MVRSVYIIGSKGIPAKYGGFETFVEKLTEMKKSDELQYYVACMEENSLKSNINKNFFKHNEAYCFSVKVPEIGSAKAILYDILSLEKAIKISAENKDENPIFYILACRIGPFIAHYKKVIAKMNGTLYVNPDGHEWLRKKWNRYIRKYWKFSEKLMVKHSDLLICDSKNIEKYILTEYAKFSPRTKYIAYGTDISKSSFEIKDDIVRKWFDEKKILEKNYFLLVGRFVPENNFETIIKEFIKSDTTKDLVLVTNVEKNNFLNKLKETTSFDKDSRIKFVGTVYNTNLLKYIRENAYAYIHGHEVGGTNPSLLEALAYTKINLLLNVGFNREVASTAALYWNKDNLFELINKVDGVNDNRNIILHSNSRDRIMECFTWEFIVKEYEELIEGKNI